MDILVPLPIELAPLARSGRIKTSMLSTTGMLLVNINDLPVHKEETPEYKAVADLKGIPIGMRQAGEKYNIQVPTISQWVEMGIIQRLSGEVLRGQRVMIDEADIAYCAQIYHQNPGRGRRLFNPDGSPYRHK